MSIVVPECISDVQSDYVKDLETRKLIEEVENNKETKSKYIHGKKTYYGTNKEYIYPGHKNSKLKSLKRTMTPQQQAMLVSLKHTTISANPSFGREKKTDIQKYVAECDTCQRHKFETVDPPGILQPLHIPTQKWSKVSMDFIIDLPTSEEKEIIFVVIDRLIKYDHFISISSK